MQQVLGSVEAAGVAPLACKMWGEEPGGPHSPYRKPHELPDASNSTLFNVDAAKVCLA